MHFVKGHSNDSRSLCLSREAAAVRNCVDVDSLAAFELYRGTELDVVYKTLKDVLAYSGTVESLSPGSEVDTLRSSGPSS